MSKEELKTSDTTKCQCFSSEKQPRLIKENRFHHLLTDERLYQEFDKFLINEHSNENLLFYRRAIELEQCEDPKIYKKMAKEIAQEFLGIPGSEQKLNLPTHYIQNIEAALKNKKFNNKIFLEARMDIEAILRTKYVAFCNV